MSVHVIGGQSDKMKEGDVQIQVNGDQIIMRQCVVVTSVMTAEQAAALGEAYASNLGRAARDAMAVRMAVMQPAMLAVANGNGVAH